MNNKKMRIEAIISDMDGSILTYPNKPFNSSWDALAEAFSDEEKEEWKQIRDFYYPKRNLYPEWYKKQVAFLKGVEFERVDKHLFPIPYSKGAREFFLNTNNIRRGILTSGLKLVADKIADELGFDYVIGNHLEIKDGVFTGNGVTSVNLWDKGEDLLNLSCREGFDLSNTIYIGDNENDISCFSLVKFPVAFKPKTLSTRNAAKYVINDFRELNNILY